MPNTPVVAARFVAQLGLGVFALVLAVGPVRADLPSVVAVRGNPNLPLDDYDFASLGYQVEEFFISGTAISYKLKSEAAADGKWDVKAAAASPYTTRLVALRPRDPEKFSGATAEVRGIAGHGHQGRLHPVRGQGRDHGLGRPRLPRQG